MCGGGSGKPLANEAIQQPGKHMQGQGSPDFHIREEGYGRGKGERENGSWGTELETGIGVHA